MLKTSIAFVFGTGTDPVRKTIFDHLVLASFLGTGKPSSQSAEEIVGTLAKHLDCAPFSIPQVAAALQRLRSQGLVTFQEEQYRLTEQAISAVEAATIEVNTLSTSAISDVVEHVCSVSRGRVSLEERRKLERNARDTLAEIFRLMGMELANQFLESETPSPLYLESSDRIIAAATRQTSGSNGELLVAALADMIQNPSEEQAQMLASWALAYLGQAIMNLDPALREFQATRLRRKAFLLDTDFVLRCIIAEDPDSSACLALVRRLNELGCRLVVPEAVVAECASHAALSPRTAGYFRNTLLSLTPAFVDERVNNAFVKGYYYGRRGRQIPAKWSFEEYLGNYYNPSNPSRFIRDVIASRFPPSVEVVDIEALWPETIPMDMIASVSTELLSLLERSPKYEYRTSEQNQELANTDARMFLTALQLNTDGAPGTGNCILAGTCYIITNSSKYLRSAKALGIRDVVSTRPQKLLALLEIATGPVVSSAALAGLLENPLLRYAVEQVWPDVSLLLSNGIALTGKTLTRLRWDLDERLHDRISSLTSAEEHAEVEGVESVTDASDHEYLELVQEAASLGYPVHPALAPLQEALAQAKDEAAAERAAREAIEQRFDELATAIERFGKRKQRYLKRIARGQEHH